MDDCSLFDVMDGTWDEISGLVGYSEIEVTILYVVTGGSNVEDVALDEPFDSTVEVIITEDAVEVSCNDVITIDDIHPDDGSNGVVTTAEGWLDSGTVDVSAIWDTLVEVGCRIRSLGDDVCAEDN